uniref:Leucine rich repeats and calponin homology domain containing 3 n=1 Tax=Callorhinchus milii TaxID=7868 RepID=A0A4W3HW31_CALMI
MAAGMLLSDSSFGAVGGCGVFNGLGGARAGGGPVPWNRSVERALEEAAATGVLNLSGRKLREFPRSAANQDLTDTTLSDLSRNRLIEIPSEVCYFVSLESLNLYQNCIRSIPETVLNLQSLNFLNISRNQLTTLPGHICHLPLKVLIASNNKLVSLPEEIRLLRHLTELDVSCNEIQVLPPQVGNLEILRDLNIRRNHLVTLPEELADLPLVRLDFSCNKVTTIPVCYRNLRHLQTIVLDNNPLQSPPAQICIKGKVHIFKYLNIEACKSVPDLPEYDRTRSIGFNSCHEDYILGRPYGALDSGFNSVDSGDKRWSGNEPTDEFSDLPQRVAEIAKGQRREVQNLEHRAAPLVTNGAVEHDLDQIDYIDSCATEEEEEVRLSKGADSSSLSSQFIAYIERRSVNHEGFLVKPKAIGDAHRAENGRSWSQQFRNEPVVSRRPETLQLWQDSEGQQTLKDRGFSEAGLMSQPPSSGQYQQKSAQSPQKQSPSDSDHSNLPKSFLTRRSQHTDDSALLVSEERAPLTHSASVTQPPAHTAHPSPPYPGPPSPSYKQPTPACRPESYLFRAAMRDELKKDETTSACSSTIPNQDTGDTLLQNRKRYEDEERVIEQLRKNIESRLKVSLPNDLASALTDGVVLCHLANHVRPRSVPSIHVPSPAVPKLTMAKCRRNVENFLEASKRIGVPQDDLCSSSDVLQANFLSTQKTVDTLLTLGESTACPVFMPLSAQLAGFAFFYISVMLLLFTLYHLITVF